VTPLDAALGILLVVLCGHVGILIVMLTRGALPQRRHPQKRWALAAGALTLAGELLALRGLLGKPSPIGSVVGLLALGLVIGLAVRGSWREHPAGRAAFHAVWGAPIVAVFVVLLALR